MGKGSWRRSKRRRVHQQTAEEEALQFQPLEVDSSLCQALMWNGGQGQLQCCWPPEFGKQLCGRHRNAPHGRVRGPIPPAKLRLFREKALKGNVVSKQFYTRQLMWAFATKVAPDAQYLKDLTDQEYELCLKKVQQHVQMVGRRGGNWRDKHKVEVGAGVRGRKDRWNKKRDEELDERFGSERERYNGKEGGRTFKWYSRPVFNNYLARMGASEETCTEKECMLALAAVSDEIHKYPMVKDHLVEYAGPQCYAHLDKRSKDYRARANEKKAGKKG